MAQWKKLAVLVILLAVPALLFAQEQAQEATQPAEQGAQAAQAPAAAGAEGMTVRLSQAIGITLNDQSGQPVGTLNDMVVSDTGDIAYGVVAFRGVPNVAETDQYLVPSDRISYDAATQQATLSGTVEEIQGLMKLENGQLPASLTMAGEAAPAAAEEAAPAAEAEEGEVAEAEEGAAAEEAAPAAGARYFLASRLQGITLVGSDGQELGTGEDAVMDLQAKRVVYFALAPAGELGLGDRMYAVPLDQIVSIDPTAGRATLNINQEQLRANPGFAGDQWPSQASTEWGAAPSAAPETQAPAEAETDTGTTQQ